MNTAQAQAELNTLRTQLENLLNDYHTRTGLVVDAYVSHHDVTEFGHTRRKVIHTVEATASLKDGGHYEYCSS